jgi:hypothetical protein
VVNQAGEATRRQALGAAAVAALAVPGTSLLLDGCGSSAPRHDVHHARPLPSPTPEVAALNAALAAEQQAIAFYTAVTPLLSGSVQRAAARLLAQDLNHAGGLRELVALAGGVAHNPSPNPSYSVGSSPTRDEILATMARLEQAQIGAHLHAIPVVKAGYRRQTVASILADDAQHATVLRIEQGVPALAGAFVTS